MPSLSVPVDQFREGTFPPICARTGEPATTSRRIVVVRRGMLGHAVARRRQMLERSPSRVAGEVPLSEAAARRMALLDRVRAFCSGVAALGFVVGLFTGLWLVLSSFALIVLLGLSLYLTVGAELEKSGKLVRLLHVHPAFAAAVAGQAPPGG